MEFENLWIKDNNIRFQFKDLNSGTLSFVISGKKKLKNLSSATSSIKF